METIHRINIAVHVTAGTIALLAGFAAMLTRKGSKRHILSGRYFMWTMIMVIITGLAGVLVFHRNNFLLVITLLSGYNCFSGIRAIRLRGSRPRAIDYAAPLAVMAAAVYYLCYIIAAGLYWAPVIIYSTIGFLFLVTLYDLSKAVMPTPMLAKAAVYEHVYKMISALSALASAFTGTVFPQYQPYSQFLPGAAGFICIIVIFIRMGSKNTVLYQAN